MELQKNMLNQVVFDPIHFNDFEQDFMQKGSGFNFYEKLMVGRGVEAFDWFSMISYQSLDFGTMNDILLKIRNVGLT